MLSRGSSAPARALLVGLLAALLAWPSGALAATIAFYTHRWGLSGTGFVYFPHAFVVIERGADEPGGPSRESYGFTSASPNTVMLTGRSAGVIIPEDDHYAGLSRLHFQLELTTAQYDAVETAIAAWRTADGNRYDLRRRNCISFVAAVARAAGLATPDRDGVDPEAFMAAVSLANADRLGSAAVTPDTASGVTAAAAGPGAEPEAGPP